MNSPKPIIEGIKLIKHNMGGVNNPDDPSFPFRLDALFRVPGFMEVAASFIYGREEIVVRGQTAEKLEAFIAANNLRTHPCLIKIEITQPEVLAAAAKAALPDEPVKPAPEYRLRPGPASRNNSFDCPFESYGATPVKRRTARARR